MVWGFLRNIRLTLRWMSCILVVFEIETNFLCIKAVGNM